MDMDLVKDMATKAVKVLEKARKSIEGVAVWKA